MKDYYLKLDHEMLAWALLQRTALRRMDLIYSELIEYDMALIRPFLPEKVKYILDIGSGIAAIDARLHQIYPQAEFYLLDKTELSVEYGRETEQAFYNNQRAAYRLLGKAGVKASRIHLLDATPDYCIDANDIDLAVSIFSWGWHFPLDTYARAVADVVVPGGLLVMDIRNWKGKEILLKSFDIIGRLALFDGHRCFFTRREEEEK